MRSPWEKEPRMSENTSPEGPDLAEGVPSADVAEGAMLAGRVGEEAVLIARVGGVLHAIGAECTHYHGPLAKGLIKDGAVRCPWHHACFSLTTGEAIGAPAFDPVACYTVTETDGKIVVGDKLATAPAKAASPTAVGRVVIVGRATPATSSSSAPIPTRPTTGPTARRTSWRARRRRNGCRCGTTPTMPTTRSICA
jgi:nitrite reductase/ring-hydroxylating ferredoxin subunit